MGKIKCICGNIIVDQSDAIKWKGHFIADQDYDEFLNVLDKPDSIEKRLIIHKVFHQIFQCSSCSNLIVFRNGETQGVSYKPENPEISKEILRSTYGNEWKGCITANFRDNVGSVYWYTNIDSGFMQNLTLEQTKKTYYEKLDRLSNLHVLQSSFLSIDGEIEHKLIGNEE